MSIDLANLPDPQRACAVSELLDARLAGRVVQVHIGGLTTSQVGDLRVISFLADALADGINLDFVGAPSAIRTWFDALAVSPSAPKPQLQVVRQ